MRGNSYCPTCGERKDSRSKQCKRCQFRDNHPRETGAWGVNVHGYYDKRINKELVKQHRYVVERFIGRSLSDNEVIHHKDGDKTNNSIWNLKIMTKSNHAKLHCTQARMKEISLLGHKARWEKQNGSI